jgi:hypothetical protein
MANKQYRQGDVLLTKISKLPYEEKQLKKVKPEHGRLILARGEVTGHHHSVAASKSSSLLAGPNEEMFLLIQEGEKLLEHQEHNPVQLKEGVYKVTRQRQYNPSKPSREEAVGD